jgi:hypothetical protein
VTQKGLEVANALESIQLVERLAESLMMYVQHKTAVFVIIRGLKSLVGAAALPRPSLPLLLPSSCCCCCCCCCAPGPLRTAAPWLASAPARWARRCQ